MEYLIKAVQATIKLTETRVIIQRQGTRSAMAMGLKGDKEIPIKKITAIQIRRPGKTIRNGYIQFTIPGGNENLKGMLAATRDENSVFFNSEQLQNIEIMKSYIDSVIDEKPLDFNTLNLPIYPENNKESTPKIPGKPENNQIKSDTKQPVKKHTVRNVLLFLLAAYFIYAISSLFTGKKDKSDVKSTNTEKVMNEKKSDIVPVYKVCHSYKFRFDGGISYYIYVNGCDYKSESFKQDIRAIVSDMVKKNGKKISIEIFNNEETMNNAFYKYYNQVTKQESRLLTKKEIRNNEHHYIAMFSGGGGAEYGFNNQLNFYPCTGPNSLVTKQYMSEEIYNP